MAQQPPSTVMPSNMMPPPEQAQGSYYPAEPADLTGGLPINLDSLRDGPPGSKPFYPYSTLIRYAIKGSPNQKLLLEDIYYAIESRFPYFRTAPSGWKNSVRHNLSLNPCFEKVPRPLTDRGKGSYWTVNDNVDPRTGVHRVRKKKPKSGRRKGTSEEPQDVDYHPSEGFAGDPHGHPGFVPPPPMHPDEAGPSRQPPYPMYPPPPGFDPHFAMMPPPAEGMPRYPPAIPITPDGTYEVDENGNINWRLSWHKELGHLQQITAEQEKNGVAEEWYQAMLFRLRMSLWGPPPPPPPGPGAPGYAQQQNMHGGMQPQSEEEPQQ
ncbi:hypothetical protein CONPUDRAFT_122988 [Coniophora puteana RWD-64-598 SS2]|uniref:Fork-head domain-containing protein n=1 Tax=Coniophora puteana (strain RWD-64-598) TaxID=741705 RepID=A0A5M3MSW1_CONPW|nr:uncharacterized protein CONPUDRAFT_122988 [Coniophora puteana RWD-64-598 SS2]EIW82258.1 hypothetical protein CONPUDRAFT_122988 [Coniophora puteana RWD-64-598 SS2]